MAFGWGHLPAEAGSPEGVGLPIGRVRMYRRFSLEVDSHFSAGVI